MSRLISRRRRVTLTYADRPRSCFAYGVLPSFILLPSLTKSDGSAHVQLRFTTVFVFLERKIDFYGNVVSPKCARSIARFRKKET